MSAPHRSFSKATRLWLSVLVFAVFLVGLVAIAAATGWEEALAAAGRLTVAEFAILLTLSLGNYLLRGVRWHVFTRAIDLKTPLTTNLLHYIGGFAMTVTPGRIGELVRLRWIWRETGRRPDTTASIMIADRAADLSSVGLSLAITVALTATDIDGAWAVAAVALLLAFIATRPKLARYCLTLGYRMTGIFPRIFAGLRRAAAGLAAYSRARVLLPATALGILGWCAEAGAFWLLLTWLGADVALPVAFAVFFFSMLTGGATGLPGGIGGAEAAMIAALALVGVPFEIALPATAIIRLTTLWFAILMGIVLFPFAERSAASAAAPLAPEV